MQGARPVTGSAWVATPSDAQKVALDFAVINALGQSHQHETFGGSLQAGVGYSKKKCSHNMTQARCAAAGVAFEPMVLEFQGGVEPRAAAILHRIAEAVAAEENADKGLIKKTMLERVADHR